MEWRRAWMNRASATEQCSFVVFFFLLGGVFCLFVCCCFLLFFFRGEGWIGNSFSFLFWWKYSWYNFYFIESRYFLFVVVAVLMCWTARLNCIEKNVAFCAHFVLLVFLSVLVFSLCWFANYWSDERIQCFSALSLAPPSLWFLHHERWFQMCIWFACLFMLALYRN